MRLPLAALFTLTLPLAAAAHEFWLDPAPAFAAPTDSIAVRAFVGTELAGQELGYYSTMQTTVDLFHDGQASKLAGRTGDTPAFRFQPRGTGLHVLRYVSTANVLTYDSYAKYLKFLDEADRPDLAAAHDARGLSREGIREVYTRYAKTLIAVGDGAGEDPVTGMALELMARENPFQRDGDAVTFELLLAGQPLADAALHMFHRSDAGAVTSHRLRTGPTGTVEIPVPLPGFYLVNAIQIFPSTPQITAASGAQWVSLWASSSFSVR